MTDNKNDTGNQKKDTQSRSWIVVINNYEAHNISPPKFEEIISNLPNIRYWCYSLEEGAENNTPHIQAYFVTRNPIRFSTMQNKFNKVAHLEPAKGTPQENVDYVKKQGKWEDTDKASTSTGFFKEWGELPKSQQGRRSDLISLYELVKEGFTDSEIIDSLGEIAIKHVDKIPKLRLAYLRDKFKSQRRLDLKVNYVAGKTGAGKSRDILDEHGDENVYRVTDYQHPFDSYQCEPVLAFEEFRSSLRLEDMLNYLDIYPIILPARYAPKVGCYLTVYVVSNWSFEQQYSEYKYDPEQKSSYEAWVRRFNGFVKIYSENEVIKYPTMQDYLNRKYTFQNTTSSDNPFSTPKGEISQNKINNVKQEQLSNIPYKPNA